MTKAFKGRLVLSGVVLWSLSALAAGGCSTNEADGGSAATGGNDAGTATPCQEAFGTACGAACSDDTPCAAGLYCDGGVCTADCITESDCASGTCSPGGRCVVEEPDAGGPPILDVEPSDGGSVEVTPDSGPACIEGQVEFTAVMPQVWLLLDRSGSMVSPLGTTTRWEALGAVILGDPADPADRGVVGDFEDRAAFGAVFYTSGSAPTGCILDLESVALAANSYTKIRQRYNKLGPAGNTPTADSIAATTAVASTSDLTGGPKILVLATDGQPAGCAPREGAATTEVEKEVAKAFAKDIKTFAVSIATETDAPHMQRVANIGVGLPADADPPAPYYTAESQEQLRLAFSTILEDVPRSCVFSLNGKVDEENADQGSVTLAGEALAYGDENGWALARPDQVELLGTACEQIQAGEQDLDITFPCAVFTPIVVK